MHQKKIFQSIMKQKFLDDISNTEALKKPYFWKNMVSLLEFSQKIDVLQLFIFHHELNFKVY